MERLSEQELLRRAYKLGINSLRDFSVLTDKDYKPAWFHVEIAKALQAVERGEIKRLILEMPPRHGKTQLATINFPAWYLGRHPDHEIITASYSGELAEDFGGKTRDLVASPEYQAIFATRLKADSTARSRWSTDKGGSYTAVGVGGAITGRGANILIIDDPLRNREEAESDTMRGKVWDWYTSTARTRLEGNGAVIVIMTRWHVYDLVGLLLDQERSGGEKWHRITFPALAEDVEPFRQPGEPLWPSKFSLEDYSLTRHAIGERDWLALYQQHPVWNVTADFKPEWFRKYNPSDLQGKDLVYVTAVDLAISSKQGADNSVIRTIAKERNKPEIYLVEEHAGHFDPGQTVELIFQHVAAYQPLRVGIEAVAFQKSMAYFVREEQRRRSVYFDVVEIKQTGDKQTRLRGLAPMYRAGSIYHRPADSELESELLQFPQGKHDDRVDALQMCIQLLQPTNFGGSGKARVSTPHLHRYGQTSLPFQNPGASLPQRRS